MTPAETRPSDLILPDVPAVTVWFEATNNLRWNNGVLEQQFVVYGLDRGKIHGGNKEWRPVPAAADTTQERT